MKPSEFFDDFSQLLLKWRNPLPGRDLPWAFEPNPYKVWISEIMLQQTQATTVIPYYLSFIEKFPDITSLTEASIDEVLNLWTGLGYYSRARNLHRAAQQIADQHNGQFPTNFEEILALPGVGLSTAGAICALAFGHKAPILDGNAKRVYARSFCVDDEKDSQRTRRLWKIADACTPAEDCQKYTQNIMDLGATVCTPRNPKCEVCPVGSLCCAKSTNLIEKFPARKQRVIRKTKAVTLVVALDQCNRLLLERRPPAGIWGGLWSFPEYSDHIDNVQKWFWQNYTMKISIIQTWDPFHHDFTHFRLNITPLLVQIADSESHRFLEVDIDLVSLDKPL
ncbi:MAG: A/G-specific adenine glycosylase, partial [Gammaproteobacteria bacterium]|nr:A/G-specific adenine glycosylase [Gammaproteobacteria bacterium]